MREFSNVLKQLRRERNLSQRQLAEDLQISFSMISMLERGERKPSFDMQGLIADYFNVDMDYLLGKTLIRNRTMELGDGDVITTASLIKTSSTLSASERLAYVMDVLGKSPEDVATACGSTPERIQAIIDGVDRYVDIQLMLRICDYFKVPKNFFITQNANPVKDLQKNIESLLEIDNITVDELVKRLDISIEDLKRPTFSTLEKIADYYGFTIEDLMFRDFSEALTNEHRRLRITLYISSAQWLNRVGSMLTNNQFDEVVEFAKYVVARDKKRDEM